MKTQYDTNYDFSILKKDMKVFYTYLSLQLKKELAIYDFISSVLLLILMSFVASFCFFNFYHTNLFLDKKWLWAVFLFFALDLILIILIAVLIVSKILMKKLSKLLKDNEEKILEMNHQEFFDLIQKDLKSTYFKQFSYMDLYSKSPSE